MNILDSLGKMFSAYILLVAVVLNNQIASLQVASAAVKRSVLEESIITLLKEEERNNREFKATILNTMQTELKDIRDVISLNVSKLIQSGRYQNEKTLSSLELILSKLYCPSEFRYIEHSCFKLSNVSVNWESAKRKCQEENSHVALDSLRFKSLMSQESLKNDVTIWTTDARSVLNSSLLTTDQVEQLIKWFPGKAFKLLFKGNRDGMFGAYFHEKCDNKGPTISFGKEMVTGTVYGGYASASWGSSGSYLRDTNAFLFKLCVQGCSSVRYNVENVLYAMYDHVGSGPSFGKGPDLSLFSDGRTGSCKHSSYNTAINCGVSIQWNDVEVWSVVDSTDCFAFNSGNQTTEKKSCTHEARYVCEL